MNALEERVVEAVRGSGIGPSATSYLGPAAGVRDALDWSAELSRLARYRFAAAFIKRTDAVVDIGCGAGLGSRLMADCAARVCGVDHDPEAIRHCMAAYEEANLQFELVHSDDLGLGVEGYDVAVMMDVLQHVPRDCGEVAVARIKRGLPEKGLFICSTPRMTLEGFQRRRRAYGHIHEYTYDEFRGLLAKYFDRVAIFSQLEGAILPAAPEVGCDFVAVCVK